MKIILLFTITFLLLAVFAIITSGSGEEEQKEVGFFTLFHWYIVRHDFARVIILCVQRSSLAYKMILRSLDLLLRKKLWMEKYQKHQSVSSGIHASERGCVRYYCDDQTVCDLCQYMETHPDVMEWADIYICEFLSDIKE